MIAQKRLRDKEKKLSMGKVLMGINHFCARVPFATLYGMKEVTLDLLVSPGCQICRRFEGFWETEQKNWPTVYFKKIDVTTPEGQELAGKHMIFASPGIILNGELWATGGYDQKKFVEKLKALSQ